MQKAEKRVGRELSPEERRDAEEDIIRSAQQENFQEEYKALAQRNRPTDERNCKIESTLR